MQELRHPSLDDFFELVEGCWSADGTVLALTDNGGRLLLFGNGLHLDCVVSSCYLNHPWASVAFLGTSLSTASAADLPLSVTGGSTAISQGSILAPYQQYFAADSLPAFTGPSGQQEDL